MPLQIRLSGTLVTGSFLPKVFKKQIAFGPLVSVGAFLYLGIPPRKGFVFYFTPVPGGVGPLAAACLFENAVTLAERVNY